MAGQGLRVLLPASLSQCLLKIIQHQEFHMSPFLLQHNQHRWPQNNFSFPFLKAQCVRETVVIYIPNVNLHRGDVLGHVLQCRQVLWQELLPEDRQQPEDCDPQIGNHFPTRIKEQFWALTTTGLYLRVQEGASKPIPILTTSHRRVGFGLAEERGNDWPTLTDLGAGHNCTASKWFLFHMFLSL